MCVRRPAFADFFLFFFLEISAMTKITDNERDFFLIMFSGVNVTGHLIKDKALYNIALHCVVLNCIFE